MNVLHGNAIRLFFEKMKTRTAQMHCFRDLIVELLLPFVTLAQASTIPQASDSFFSDLITTRICAYILMLPRFCSWALALLQNFVHAQLQKLAHVTYFPACALVLNMKRINCYSISYLLHL